MSDQSDPSGTEASATPQDGVRKEWTPPTIERVDVIKSTNKTFSPFGETTSFGPAGS